MPVKKGYKQTPEHIARRAAARKGFRHTEQTKKRISKIKKQQGIRTKGTLGWHPTEETRRKMSVASKGRKLTTEQRLARKGSGNPNWRGGKSKRRGFFRSNGGSHTNEQWNELKRQYNFTCPKCGRKEPQIKLWKDHILPAVSGGFEFIENIQPLCGSCNRKKFTKTFFAGAHIENVKPNGRKTILFIASYRAHLARQQILLAELEKHFNVIVRYFEPDARTIVDKTVQMMQVGYLLIKRLQPDVLLVRGDRYEVLPLASVGLYAGKKIVHLEGGDLSGVIDNKIRHAVTQLADYHFCTNAESHQRLVSAGIQPQVVWNHGSLDVEYAQSVVRKKVKTKPYLLVAYHPIENENEEEVTKALESFSKYEIIKIASNKDYGRQYGEEQYEPEVYINLMRGAACLIGNSSSFLKEASMMGVGVVNIGTRQAKRLKPKNVLDVPCESERIKRAIEFQLKNKYEPDDVYFKANTSKRIAETLKEIL